MKKMFKNINEFLPLVLVFVGGLLSAIGGVWLGIMSAVSSKKTEQKIETISQLSEESKRQQLIIKEKQEKIEELQNKNFDLSQAISQKSIEISEYQIAKDSYCFLKLFSLDSSNDVGHFFMTGRGKYSLHNINIAITDLIKMKAIATPNFTNLHTFQSNLYFESYNPNIKTSGEDVESISQTHFSMSLDKHLGVDLLINIITSNKKINERIKMSFIREKWETAIKVNVEGTSIAHIEIDKGYPIQNPDEIFKE